MNSAELVADTTCENKKVYLAVKRCFDIVFSLACLIILSPILLIVAIAIKLESKGTIIYKHRRLGKNGKIIYLYKFRSMYSDADERLKEMLKDDEIRKEWEDNYKIHHDPRITKVGKFIRRTSLDEIPQLVNILVGDMSLIGPRPVIEVEIKKYGKNKDKFLSVTPGLTGWWACNGRSNITYKERMELELYYVDNMSFILDAKIFFKTFFIVLKHDGSAR